MYNLARMFHINLLEFTSCNTTPCLNDGICMEIDGKHRCSCAESFHGPFCEFSSKNWTNDWTITEITLLLVIVFLLTCAVATICCCRNMGFYISIPNKCYKRWEEGEFSDDEDVVITLSHIRNRTIRTSYTTETIVEAEPSCTSSQKSNIVNL
ncbi:EGF-like domain protein [Dictyocaulus viviparus]|uniref:EGF-like domain protein n=1 Tax=Dictyocaulus viviparus TaxID=29172 RepID=A0A0D8XCU9_DICVI|nr:EGF-like domain protein [Dictyocaulus viviparus]